MRNRTSTAAAIGVKAMTESSCLALWILICTVAFAFTGTISGATNSIQTQLIVNSTTVVPGTTSLFNSFREIRSESGRVFFVGRHTDAGTFDSISSVYQWDGVSLSEVFDLRAEHPTWELFRVEEFDVEYKAGVPTMIYRIRGQEVLPGSSTASSASTIFVKRGNTSAVPLARSPVASTGLIPLMTVSQNVNVAVENGFIGFATGFSGLDSGNAENAGVFTDLSGALVEIAGPEKPPVVSGSEFASGFNRLRMTGGTFHYFARTEANAVEGLWRDDGGGATNILLRGQTAPGVPGSFYDFRALSEIQPSGDFVFSGRFQNPFREIVVAYESASGTLQIVADETTLMPGTYRTIEGFGNVAMDGTDIAFEAWIRPPGALFGVERFGVYLLGNRGGIQKVLDTGDEIDDRKISSVGISRNGLSASDLAALVMFADDNSTAIYQIQINAPVPALPSECVLAVGTMGGIFFEDPTGSPLPFTNYVDVVSRKNPPITTGSVAEIIVTNMPGIQDVRARAELTIDAVTGGILTNSLGVRAFVDPLSRPINLPPVGTDFSNRAVASQKRRISASGAGGSNVQINLNLSADGNLWVMDSLINNPATPGKHNLFAALQSQVIVYTTNSTTVIQDTVALLRMDLGNAALSVSGEWNGHFSLDPTGPLQMARYLLDYQATTTNAFSVPANMEFVVEHRLVAEAFADIDAHFWLAGADMLNSSTFNLSSEDPEVTIIEITPTAVSKLSVVQQGSNRQIRLIDAAPQPLYNLEYADEFDIWNPLDTMSVDGADQVFLDSEQPSSGRRFYRAIR